MNVKVTMVARYLLGVLFLVFGGNGLAMVFFGGGFLPMPEPSPQMATVMGGFFGAVYLIPLVKILEVLAALLLLSGKYVNLAIVLLGPIVVNILGIHLFVDLSGAPMAVFILILWGILLRSRWNDFRPLLKVH